MESTEQMSHWKGDFGKAYTERLNLSGGAYNKLYVDNYGVTRDDINKTFFGDLKIDKVLEVGCNVGLQLMLLQKLGIRSLWGAEINLHAIEIAKRKTERINIVESSAFDLPFKDGFFDLVMTNGVLIHISPDDINRALDEIYRVSGRFIFGFEYFAEGYQKVEYRGNDELLWKTNFCRLYMDRFPDLELVKEKKFPYLNDDNMDSGFLLKKRG